MLSCDAAPVETASYHRRLLAFLSVAAFFEGYDFLALAQLLPNLREHYGLSPSQGGLLVSVVNSGTMIAYALVRLADRLGRARVMSITIAGYTVMSLISGFAPNALLFAAAQLLARIFLIGEWAVSLVMAAEEFPAERRGSALGIIQASSSLGAVACAGLVPLLVKSPFGWRTVYFVGAVPLVLLAFARRSMRETKRFEALSKTEDATKDRGLFSLVKGPRLPLVLRVALVWALCYACTQNAVTFWKEFAMADRGLTEGDVGLSVTIAAVGSLPLAFLAGKLIDRIGRKPGAVIIFGTASLGTAGAYLLHGHALLTLSLVLAIFGATAVLTVLNAFTAELFPTAERASAFAWCNNLLGRIGYVLSPMIVGWAAGHWGWSLAVSATALLPLVALALVYAWFPETRGRDLDAIEVR